MMKFCNVIYSKEIYERIYRKIKDCRITETKFISEICALSVRMFLNKRVKHIDSLDMKEYVDLFASI